MWSVYHLWITFYLLKDSDGKEGKSGGLMGKMKAAFKG